VGSTVGTTGTTGRTGSTGSTGSVPGRTPLSQERIIAAALDLADTRGDFSMRALGEKLGVDPMAIYRHFRDKDALLDALVDAALADLAPADIGLPIERLRQLCIDFRSSLVAHPGVASRIRAALPTLGPHVIGLTEASLGLILEVGVDAREASRVFVLLIGFVTMSVEEEQHVLAEFQTEQAWRAAVSARYASLSPTAHPSVIAMAAEREHVSFHDDFEYGLDLLLDAIARRRERSDTNP
jgi:TetR/AcrR family tetracycline transcriptional repressor